MRKHGISKTGKYIVCAITAIMFITVLAASPFTPGTALAEESSSAKANTGVYLYSEEPVEPVDPTDPTDPTDPVEPTEPTDRPTPDENGDGQQAPTENKPQDQNENKTGGGPFAKTGDNVSLFHITGILCILCGALIFLCINRKGDEDDEQDA